MVGTETDMNTEIYLDNNATTLPASEVREAMWQTLCDGFGNPSSAHRAGDRVRVHLRGARRRVAELLGTGPEHVIFTGGGTEANNMVLFSAVARTPSVPCRIVTDCAEHSSVLVAAKYLQRQGIEIVVVPVARDGFVEFDALDQAVTPNTSLVSVQWVNNETGVVQPVEEIGALCRSRGVPFHTDACQAVGKLAIDLKQLPIDLLTLTAHKIHGPQGAGAVFAHDPAWLAPLLHGGPQEHGLRAGTENMSGIVGLGVAAEIRRQQFGKIVAKLRQLRDQFEQRVRKLVPDVTVNGNIERRVCNTTNLCFHGVDGQALVARLDQNGIRCSQSSACTNQRPEPSYVLRAMGLSEDDAYASVRFSIGVFNTEQGVETAAIAIRDLCQQLRGFSDRIIPNPYHAART